MPFLIWGTVIKSSSNATWYCGHMCLELGFSTNATLCSCTGDLSRHINTLDLGSHFGMPFGYDSKCPSRMCHGHPHVCWLLRSTWHSALECSCIWDLCWLFRCKVLWLWAAPSKVNIHNMVAMASSQCLFASINKVLADKVRYFSMFSINPFWWWVPTPKKCMSWFLPCNYSLNAFSAKRQLSAWKLLIMLL